LKTNNVLIATPYVVVAYHDDVIARSVATNVGAKKFLPLLSQTFIVRDCFATLAMTTRREASSNAVIVSVLRQV
jgi:hypothetical protein